MWPNPQENADLVIFTEEILNGKLHFLCNVWKAFSLFVCLFLLIIFNQFSTSIPPLFSNVLGGIKVENWLKMGYNLNPPCFLVNLISRCLNQWKYLAFLLAHGHTWSFMLFLIEAGWYIICSLWKNTSMWLYWTWFFSYDQQFL